MEQIIGGDLDITEQPEETSNVVQEGGVTVQEFAAAREELEKSMVEPNKQVRTITLRENSIRTSSNYGTKSILRFTWITS